MGLKSSTALRSPMSMTASDLISVARDIRDSKKYGNAEGAKAGTALLQTFLLKKDAEWLLENQDDVLKAFEMLEGWKYSNGRRVASYLMVHTRIDEARSFWAGIENVLETRG